jgi:hypothetical protein
LGTYAFEQQLATAKYLASQSEFRPHFLLISEADHQFINHLGAASISYSLLNQGRRNGGPVSALGADSQKGLRPRVQSMLKAFRWPRQLWFEKRVAKRFVRSLKPFCSIVSQERPYPFLPVLKTLKDLKIPVILMPAADSSPDGPAGQRRSIYLLKSGLNALPISTDNSKNNPVITILNRLVQRSLPSQIYNSAWGKMLYYPASKTLALKLMGMLPQNPWYQGTTFADYIMISGTDEADMYAEAKVDPDKLLYFGTHELDMLHESRLKSEQIRHELIDRYHLDSNQKILIVSLPRLMEQNLTSEPIHWQAINDILDVLSRQNYNVVVSMHPDSDLSLYTWMEDKYQVQIVREPLKNILVIADIYVASYSSTIRWAIGLGIPVINLDFWDLNLVIFRNLTGFQTVTTLAEFDDLARNFATTPNCGSLDCGQTAVGTLADDVLTHSPELARARSEVLVDGKAKERLLRFIQSIDFSNRPSAFGDKLPANTGLSEN